MSAHAQFEKLCALAASGQLTAAEAKALDAHLRECNDCRRFLSDACLVSDTVVSRLLPVPSVESKIPEGMRERFLARAAAEGLRINAGAPIAAPPSFAVAEPHAAATSPSPSQGWMRAVESSARIAWSGLAQYWQPVGLAAAACAVCFALGMIVRLHDGAPANSVADHSTAANPNSPAAASFSASDKDRLLRTVRDLTAERDSLAQQRAQLMSKLAAVNRARHNMKAAFQAKISTLESDAAHDHDSLTQQTVALSDRVLALQSQLDALQLKQTVTEAALDVQQQETEKYFSQAGKLEAQLATQPRVPLINRDEVESLVTARNLHIIDVYDSDGPGKRPHAFGRIFYVEGRSLVFYAYDLGRVYMKKKKKITFHVWGTHDGKEITISLGILHDQDPGEQRWSLTYSNPKVLARIDSVFVTMEPSNRNVTSPTGKQVLYAFLGGKPNHP